MYNPSGSTNIYDYFRSTSADGNLPGHDYFQSDFVDGNISGYVSSTGTNNIIYGPNNFKGSSRDKPPGISTKLFDNGGPTFTYSIIGTTSAAYNYGDPTNTYSPTDQRGFFRLVNGRLDVGSYEYNNSIACIHLDMMVYTKNGEKKISEIVAGDYVQTLDGSYIAVIYNIVNDHTDSFYRIGKNLLGENTPDCDFYIRPGHPILLNGKEVLPEELDGAESVKISKQANVYSLCTENRTVFRTAGNLYVYTWNKAEWEDTSKKLFLKWTKQ